MEKIITKSKLAYFWNKVLQLVSHKVDKEAGKGLSTNDFTDEYKDKIDNGATPDWKQNDETQPGYIKNRTHWVEYDEPTSEETLPETTLEFELYGGIDYSVIDGALREEAKLIINIDGIVYEATTRRLRDSYGDYIIEAGNENLPQGDKEGAPFYLCSYVDDPEEGIWIVILSSNPEEYGVEEHTVSITSIYQEKTYVPLDERYIPEYKQKWENIIDTPFSFEDLTYTIDLSYSDTDYYREFVVVGENKVFYHSGYYIYISKEECSSKDFMYCNDDGEEEIEDFTFTFNEDGFGYYYDNNNEIGVIDVPSGGYTINDVTFPDEGIYVLNNPKRNIQILGIYMPNINIPSQSSNFLSPRYIPDSIKLPIVNTEDTGKILQVNEDGEWAIAENTSDVQIEVDSELSDTSTNPVANNVIKEVLDTKADKTELEGLATEQYVNSAVNEKQNTITGAATTITSSNLTANRALISNGSGKVAVSDITNTELNYLDGVTSNIQTQLNNKANTSQLNGLATEAYVQEQLGNVSFDESLLDSKADKYAPTIESRIDIEAEQIPTIFMKSNNGVNTRQFLIEGNTNQGGGLTFGPSADDTYTNRRYLAIFDPVSAPHLEDALQLTSIEDGVHKGYNVFHSGVGGVFGGIAQADAESQKLLEHPQLRNITISNVDLVAGESELPEGMIYLVYE